MDTKQIIIIAVVVAFIAIGVRSYAFSKQSIEMKVEKITEKMSRKLDLTDDQRTAVFQINLDRAAGHKQAYSEGRNKETLHEAVRNWETSLRKILSPAQQESLGI